MQAQEAVLVPWQVRRVMQVLTLALLVVMQETDLSRSAALRVLFSEELQESQGMQEPEEKEALPVKQELQEAAEL